MKRLLLAVLLVPSVAFAWDDDEPKQDGWSFDNKAALGALVGRLNEDAESDTKFDAARDRDHLLSEMAEQRSEDDDSGRIADFFSDSEALSRMRRR